MLPWLSMGGNQCTSYIIPTPKHILGYDLAYKNRSWTVPRFWFGVQKHSATLKWQPAIWSELLHLIRVFFVCLFVCLFVFPFCHSPSSNVSLLIKFKFVKHALRILLKRQIYNAFYTYIYSFAMAPVYQNLSISYKSVRENIRLHVTM